MIVAPRGLDLRRFLPLTLACACFAFSVSARAQQFDIAVGASTLFSTAQTTSSQAFLPPPERGGLYPSVSGQFLLTKHFGIHGEFLVRRTKALYNGFQNFRPFLYDANAVYVRRLGDDAKADFMAGVGGQTVLFYNEFSTCITATCPILANTTHFMAHAGVDVRYYFCRNVFLRPEIHYYRVINNSEFHSDNVFRAGASIGYTFGR